MPAARDDYLLRLITQAAASARRLRERLIGSSAAADEVSREAAEAIGDLLGPQHELLRRLDPRSAAAIVGDTERVRAWSGLLQVQADAERLRGNAQLADRLADRASALVAALPDDAGT